MDDVLLKIKLKLAVQIQELILIMAQIFVDDSHQSRTVEWFSRYTRCTQRNLVSVVKLTDVSKEILGLKELPAMMIKHQDNNLQSTSLFSIIRQLAKEANLETIFFGMTNEDQLAITSFMELSQSLPEDELIDYLNKHFDKEARQFLVGPHITAADFITFCRLIEVMHNWHEYDKHAFPHVFRWADHIQHLIYIEDYVNEANLFISFPQTTGEMTKSQLKKLQKDKWKQQKKLEKKEGKKAAKEESKEAPEEAQEEEKINTRQEKKK